MCHQIAADDGFLQTCFHPGGDPLGRRASGDHRDENSAQIEKNKELKYIQTTSKIGFRLERKLPRLSDRKRMNINAILIHLRSLNPGALAQPKFQFFKCVRYSF